ncbi:SidA/IucD/PvdA family monooxygenase [Kitasatospora sp. NPDC094019]|uniref:SidA/IucD/PvdA family monooxygenase n=1 Tax=Kitasatospora sp. NPDC094019 TaxID=3364091 RepID=UPI00381E5BF7
MKDPGTRDDPYDVIGLGFGPSNIALAIAAQEIAPDRSCLFLERSPDVSWHEGMLIDGARMQISFLKDLVSLRNLASPFTFLAYQKAKGRLEKFVNLAEFRPTRLEFQDYLRWVGGQFSGLVRYRSAVTSVSPVRGDDGTLSLLRVTATDTATGEVVEYHARNVVHGLGGLPKVPAGVTTGPSVVHSSAFLSKFPGAFTDHDRGWEFAVAGDGQSAGEITHYLLDRYRNSRVHLVLPGYSLSATDNNPFANEQFFEANADAFYSRSEENRRDYAARLRDTNYAVVEAGFLDDLYRLVYADEVRGRTRLVVHDGSRLTSAESDGTGVRVGVHSRFGAGAHELRTDGLVLATGYRRDLDPGMYRDVLPHLRTDDHGRPVVSQDHRACATEELTCGLYLQGLSETTHGLGETLLSLLPFRSKQIITAIAKDGGSMARAFPPARDDFEALAARIGRCDSGTVISAGPSEFPVAIRLPLTLDRNRGRRGVLFGVLDRTDAVPLTDGGKVLAVFDPAPAGEAVSVTVRGHVRLVSDRERIAGHLAGADPAEPAGPPDVTVGIEIEIETLSGRVGPSREQRAVGTDKEGQS